MTTASAFFGSSRGSSPPAADGGRSQAQPEPSYSERQLYEQAIDRMSREVSVIEKISENEAVSKIERTIEASPKRKRAAQLEEEARDEAA